MALTLDWNPDPAEVSETRLRCYAKADRDRAAMLERLTDDRRCGPGDYLLARDGGEAVGTATHLSMRMFVRGGEIPAQGVAWVGAIKTARRRGEPGTPGVATVVMHEMLRRARDGGDVVSALMPFRASYYQHFGYGVVERRVDWTLPVPTLPTGNFDGIRYYRPSDAAARAGALARVNRNGQCDIARIDGQWAATDVAALDGFQVIDRPGDGPARGWMSLLHLHVNGKDVLRVAENFAVDTAAVVRQLHFLASLKDQYAAVEMTVAADLPLNWLLKEIQLPHRPVNHAVAAARPHSRMQLRVLDNVKFFAALRLPRSSESSVVVAVTEPEGHQSRFGIVFTGDRAEAVSTDRSPQFQCPAHVWAAVATGEMSASTAVRFGLAEGTAGGLDTLAAGPVPFCHEYF